MTVFKSIKPTRLKQDVFRLEALNGMRKIGRGMQRDFQATVASWKTPVRFEMIISLQAPGPTVVVDTNSEIYRFVNDGTRPHVILPVNKKVLKFNVPSTPKTQPRIIGSSAGSVGDTTVFSRGVFHPGTQPREFSATIAEKWQSRFTREMENSMRRAVRKSGHAI